MYIAVFIIIIMVFNYCRFLVNFVCRIPPPPDTSVSTHFHVCKAILLHSALVNS